MILEKISIHNFRQFKGFQKMSFSKKNESNITLILGDNTSGKSTLLQSFLWCLYGKIEFESKEQLCNLEKINEMSEGEVTNVEVRITLAHQGIRYEIHRVQKVEKHQEVGRLQGNSVLSINERTELGETVHVK